MQLNFEYLPATGGAQQELVLLHGWGSNREIWRHLLLPLRPWANITLVDLPGCAPGCDLDAPPQLAQTLAAILNCSPAKAVYLGWSLGGQLAVELGARYPERVAAVVTLCSNPRFVATTQWPGMDAGQFSAFRAVVVADPGAALRRFDSLQITGSRQPRQLLRHLPRQGRERASRQLLAGLHWLATLDQRDRLPALIQPQLHLLAELDGLLPAGLEQSLTALLLETPSAQVQVLAGASHVAPLDAPDTVAQEIRVFLANAGVLNKSPHPTQTPTKKEVADSFSRAAGLYDSVAKLQRDVGAQLLTSLDQLQIVPATVLDLGCGTGYFYADLRRRYPDARYLGLDLAQGMVEFARDRAGGAEDWLVGDAEALPLAANSVDLVFSSLAVQWCYRPEHLFAELSRVLRPGGYCVFTSLGPDTLRELRAAWAAVDSHQHVNTFLPPSELATAARQVPGIQLELDNGLFRMEYQRVRDLLAELKTLGAHNMNRDRPAGLTSRRTMAGMLQAYEAWREDGVLPATYDVIFGVLEKA
ncbi:MAG: malonyl-[acyl-carrier protein] O-methyltransferase BioC [Gammaproteobacteria bacterium]|nr:MAG: malonyl-[acyl-carrier protein] O-methyltransferase BioC [Gammaproteobacteria bacterium]RLA59322.1 MAG: malonyl-[acyl-carrier protein] O-methyltransferase BioC [Gammaproteobacteria bacterium]